MSFVSGSTKKMFAAGDGKIYDVTSSGALPAASVSGMTNNKWQHINFATTAGQYLYIVNGADSARHFDGASWAIPTITGITSSTLCHIMSHKSRIWFLENGSTDAWYLPVDSIAGAATTFPVGGQLLLGGYLMAMSSWSIDAGSGPDDVLALWSSEGEVLVYAGADPGSDYSLIGRYRTAKPIGRRSMHPIGGDVAMISEDGVLALSTVMRSERLAAKDKALTAGVVDEYAKMVKRCKDVFGWQIVTYPVASMALLNIPEASDENEAWQFAYNVSTKAWSRFKGLDASCWCQHDSEIYFGTPGGEVYKAETGGSDNGTPIELACLPAFSNLKRPGYSKHVKMIQPLYSTDIGSSILSVSCAVNFNEPNIGSSTPSNPEGIFTWDASSWDGPDVWGGLDSIDVWIIEGNIGYVISPYTTGALAADEVPDFNFSLIGWHVLYENGGVGFSV
jgi:hypothetical protein